MKKIFCDACGNEITKYNGINNFSYLCHIDDLINGNLLNAYIDAEGNMISSRYVTVELCNSCYNKVLLPAVKTLHKIKEESNNGKS